VALCKICFEEVEKGIAVPGRQQACGIVHEECLARVALETAKDPQKEGLLRYLIEYEETRSSNMKRHAPRMTGQRMFQGRAPRSLGNGPMSESRPRRYARS